ncbi:Uma2 family endonuclease [Coleofasciculus chthonoplastes]
MPKTQPPVKLRLWTIEEYHRINDRSEPEPDVALVRVDPLDYADHHPLASDIYLIIEVADPFGTLKKINSIGGDNDPE